MSLSIAVFYFFCPTFQFTECTPHPSVAGSVISMPILQSRRQVQREAWMCLQSHRWCEFEVGAQVFRLHWACDSGSRWRSGIWVESTGHKLQNQIDSGSNSSSELTVCVIKGRLPNLSGPPLSAGYAALMRTATLRATVRIKMGRGPLSSAWPVKARHCCYWRTRNYTHFYR